MSLPEHTGLEETGLDCVLHKHCFGPCLGVALGGLIVQILYDSKKVAVSSWPALLMAG